MTLSSYFIGRKHYELKHDIWRMMTYMIGCVGVYYAGIQMAHAVTNSFIIWQILYGLIILLVAGIFYFLLRKDEQQLII